MPNASERPSLGSLKPRVGLPPARPPEVPKELVDKLLDPHQVEQAERELGQPGAGQGSAEPPPPVVNTPVNTSVNTPSFQPVTVTRLPVKPGERHERKPRSTTVTFRFPLSMADRLRQIAEYNNVSQTAILLEALELHLPSFPAPPENWERYPSRL
jgi:hypothetical protein